MKRIITKYAIDILLWLSATPLAFLIRLESGWLKFAESIGWLLLAGFVIKGIILYFLGLSRRSWHRLGVRDLYALVAGVGGLTFVYLLVAVVAQPQLGIPRSVPLIEGMVAILLLGAARLITRFAFEQNGHRTVRGNKDMRNVLIVGAGEAGVMIAREMLRHPRARRRPVGFIDDDAFKQRQMFVGLPVFGALEEIPQIVKKEAVDEVLIAMPSQPGEVVRRVVELTDQTGVEHRIIPGIFELLDGKVTISQIREVDVEDLLRREPVRLEMERIAEYLRGRRVLVTGAGGSIGSEIVRQVTRFEPESIVLLGRGENSIYEIERELAGTHPGLDHYPVIADVRDRDRLENVYRRFKPDVVFHAAAHKHVPLMEANPDQAILNNVLGTKNLVELALLHDVDRFVNISTDKAVNPSSVMGASKRAAELVVHSVSRRAHEEQSFVSVRFGNVLGSRGSVIPIFKKQIERGGPVTVTHPEMERYFMTIPEASQLVLQAGSMAENGQVYVLDMGDSTKIVDLAKDLISLSGLTPGQDVALDYIGMRPGEKLYEELLMAEEGTIPSPHEKIFVARKNGLPYEKLEVLLDELFSAAREYDRYKMLEVLERLIPTHQLKQNGKLVAQD